MSQNSLTQMIAIYGRVTHLQIVKTQLTLTALHESVPLRSYHVAIGSGGFQDKVRANDRLTPEGLFYVCEKQVLNQDYYLGSRWMRLSYPNVEDAERGFAQGLITQTQSDQIVAAIRHQQLPPQNTALGGGIGIHGGNGNNADTQGDFWTYGCVGLSDYDIDELYNLVAMQSAVVITH